MSKILAIDPGSVESAYVILDTKLKPIEFGKLANEKLIELIALECQLDVIPVIEMIASYGMAVGKEVFDTCIWIGRFTERMTLLGEKEVKYIYRKDEKMNLCGSMKAKDSNIVQSLIDRFAPNTTNKGKGSKKEPGWFYGFKKDIWQAYAVGVTFHDMYLKGVE